MNNKTLFKLYLIFIIIFLIPVCILITLEITQKYYSNTQIKHIINTKYYIKNKNIVFAIAKNYIENKQWLSCILMLEFFINQKIKNLGEYYNYLGICYESLDIHKLAKKYYLYASIECPYNINILENLSKIQKLYGENNNAKKTYKQIL